MYEMNEAQVPYLYVSLSLVIDFFNSSILSKVSFLTIWSPGVSNYKGNINKATEHIKDSYSSHMIQQDVHFIGRIKLPIHFINILYKPMLTSTAL